MYPALSGSRGVSRGNTSRSPFLTARPGRFEVFQRETRAEASTGLKPLWCRSGGFKRKPEHDAHGAPEVGYNKYVHFFLEMKRTCRYAEPRPPSPIRMVLPLMRNHLPTTSTPRLSCRLCGINSRQPGHHDKHRNLEIHQISFSHMRLPLMRNHLLTTSTHI